MGRSVATPSAAARTLVYLHQPQRTDDEDAASWEWDDFIEDLTNVILEKYPSFTPPSRPRWIDRECRVILENRHCSITVSEYCGLVCVALIVEEPDYTLPSPLALRWHSQNGDAWSAHLHKRYPHCALYAGGFMSNGVQVFQPISRPAGLVTSNEGVLW